MNARINTQHTKRTKGNALSHINGGIHAMRRALIARIPKGFEVWFLDSLHEVSAGWSWTGADGQTHQKELRASNVSALLILWQAVDWSAEARIAKEG